MAKSLTLPYPGGYIGLFILLTSTVILGLICDFACIFGLMAVSATGVHSFLLKGDSP
jgi:hypothetical protein